MGDAGAALGGDDVHHVDLQDLAFGVGLAGDLLVAGSTALPPLPRSSVTLPRSGSMEDDGGGDDLVGAGLHLAVLGAALRLADALADDVLGGLGGDAAELLGL